MNYDMQDRTPTPVEQVAGQLPEAMPGHWDTPGGREMAVEYAAMERVDLTKGAMSDLALANAQFLASREDLDLVVWQTAAKERIRWLSAKLALASSPTLIPVIGEARALVTRLRQGRLVREGEAIDFNGVTSRTGDVRELPHPDALAAADMIERLAALNPTPTSDQGEARAREVLAAIVERLDDGFEPAEGVDARIAWIKAELDDEPNRPLYGRLGDGEKPCCRNGNEVAHLLVEFAGLSARAALASTQPAPPASVEDLRRLTQ